ncbi:MAG: GIY-YIG nuclease family protein [Ignavibacteriales bacterium]
MFVVYVLFSKKLNKRYTGFTSNINLRLNQHNNGKVNFTKGGIPWVLIYKEDIKDKTDARKRELFLKSGAGRKILDEILNTKTEEF